MINVFVCPKTSYSLFFYYYFSVVLYLTRVITLRFPSLFQVGPGQEGSTHSSFKTQQGHVQPIASRTSLIG